MNFKIILKTLSALMLIISGFMAIPAVMALYLGESRSAYGFISVIIPVVLISLFFLTILKNNQHKNLSTRDGFLLVTLSWILSSFIGAMPYIISGAIPSLADAVFETASGFTTTGASILSDVEILPKSILFWRSLTHWLGGMGIVVLTVAILPLLGIGGLQLIKAEAPGPTVDKITPRITETAKILWFIYIGFTVLQTLLLLAGGMNLFDSLTHTFGSLATGGFSTKNMSVAFFNSAYIDFIITLFMFLAGMNFILHFKLITGDLRSIKNDTEVKAYTLIFIISTLFVTFDLFFNRNYDSILQSLRFAGFQTSSIMSTTGFATADYEKWPFFSQIILFILMFVGGCAGSTGGGIKVIRLVTLLKQAYNEMKLLIHPNGVFTLRINGHAVRKNIVYSISGFFFLYITFLLVTSFVVASSGEDPLTSFTAALATVGNIGPGLGKVGPIENYGFFKDYVKWFLSFAMIVGRLEIYTVLVIFTRRFWRI